jgi:DNA-binding transcriptional LysR family regulator
MTLGQLAYFAAVVEHGSFTRAARALHVSQPALSHQIAQLEREAGAPLLERLPRAVKPTALGERLLPHARGTVAAADQAHTAAQQVGNLQAGELRVGALLSVSLGIVPATVRAWRAAHPEVQIELLEYASVETLTAAMLAGAADVAIGPPPARWGGPQRAIGAETFVVALSPDDPLLHAPRVRLQALKDRPWVLYAPEFGLSRLVTEACAAAGFAPRPAARAHHTATALELAAAGVGPALVPGNVVGPAFASSTRPLDPPLTRELVAVTRAEPTGPVAAFIDLLVAHATL